MTPASAPLWSLAPLTSAILVNGDVGQDRIEGEEVGKASLLTPLGSFVVKGNREMGWRKRQGMVFLLCVVYKEGYPDENDPAATEEKSMMQGYGLLKE